MVDENLKRNDMPSFMLYILADTVKHGYLMH